MLCRCNGSDAVIQNRCAARLWSCKCTDKTGNNSNWGHIIIIIISSSSSSSKPKSSPVACFCQQTACKQRKLLLNSVAAGF